jgi:hypothetical protein
MDFSKPQEHSMNAFKVGKADPTLFIKTCNGDLFVCQIYVDDIYLVLLIKSLVRSLAR